MEDSYFIEIQRLFEIVRQRGLRELSLSRPDFSIAICAVTTAVPVVEMAPAQVMPPTPVVPILRPAAEEKAEAAPRGFHVASPLVGTFYRSSSPDAPPFVEIGDEVEVGQTLCIVEAMKVLNEITAEQAGVVIDFPVRNGKLVQVGDTLVVLDTGRPGD